MFNMMASTTLMCWLGWILVLGATSVTAAAPPALTLEFISDMHVAQGYGHDGDGCIIAEKNMATDPVRSTVWFDAPGTRLAQTNPGLAAVDPRPNTTFVGVYAAPWGTELDITALPGGAHACTAEPLPPTFCKNGSRMCPPVFGGFGSGLTAFTSILGNNYLNTSLLASTPDADVWQWTKVTRFNATVNVHWNYSYWVSKTIRKDGTRPLLRFQWTQSIPMQPALPVHRDCFVFDYTTRYVPGPIDPARWKAPPGVTCHRGMRSEGNAGHPVAVAGDGGVPSGFVRRGGGGV